VSAEQDANFFKIFALILAILVAFTMTIAIIANKVTDQPDGAEVSKMKQQAIDERLAPIATVKVAGASAAGGDAAPAEPKSGAEVVQAACIACHGTGAAGAPKIGDKAAWQPRADAGMDSMMNVAINGKGAMPAKGGNPSLSDEEVKAAVIDMLKESGIEVASSDAAPSAPATTPAAEPTPAPAAAPVVAAAAPTEQPAATPANDGKGKDVYARSCATCHGTGIAGAPKVGDAANWTDRIAQGDDTLYNHALNGYQGSAGYMPAKGGFAFLSDEDVKAAVDYMVNESK